jgi:hypothetical protein
MIDYYDLITTIKNDYGIKYSDVKSHTSVTSTTYSHIGTHRIQRGSKTPQKNSKALTKEEQDKLNNFWLSEDITRVSPNKRCTTQRRNV